MENKTIGLLIAGGLLLVIVVVIILLRIKTRIGVSGFKISTTVANGNGTAKTNNPVTCNLQAISPSGEPVTGAGIPPPQIGIAAISQVVGGTGFTWSIVFNPPLGSTYPLGQLYQLIASNTEGKSSSSANVT